MSVTFTATQDLDAIFPAAIARQRPHWQDVPLLDVQQMYVEGSLKRCIRVLIHVNTPKPQKDISHAYLRDACHLRPDLRWKEGLSPVWKKIDELGKDEEEPSMEEITEMVKKVRSSRSSVTKSHK